MIPWLAKAPFMTSTLCMIHLQLSHLVFPTQTFVEKNLKYIWVGFFFTDKNWSLISLDHSDMTDSQGEKIVLKTQKRLACNN